MAALPSTSSSEPALIDQVITDVFTKTVQTILESRSPNCNADPCNPSSSSSSFSSNFSFDHGPLILDVILCRQKEAKNPGGSSPAGIFVRSLSSERDELDRRNTDEKIVERWVLQCEEEDSRGVHRPSEFQLSFRKASKKIIVLLRSVYSAVRLLPAYKLFRDFTASGKPYSINLFHRISSFAEPFSREEDSEMRQLEFGPVEIFSTKFSISVAYLKKTIEKSRSESSNCMSSEFIMDYVGSPLANPRRWFPSRCVSGSAPSYAAFCRQHSCRGLNLVASSSSITCVSSPSSSSSATPSRVYLRSESAPGSITLFRQNQCLLASSCSSRKSTQEFASNVDVFGAQVNLTSVSKTLPLRNQLQFGKESLRFMEFQTGKLLSKTTFIGKDSAGHITGYKTPRSSPHRKSRTSSRMFFMDEFDDSDFICHFAEDIESKNSFRAKSGNDDDHASENLTAGRSPDAAVGALVWMFKSAPPLRRDNSNQKSQLEKMKSNSENDALKADNTFCLDIKTPEPFKLRTAADAFRELKAYKGFRELIIKQSESQLKNQILEIHQ